MTTLDETRTSSGGVTSCNIISGDSKEDCTNNTEPCNDSKGKKDKSSGTDFVKSDDDNDKKKDMSTTNPLKVLTLLDAYSMYHTNGTDKMRQSYWNITKAKYRTNGGSGAALLPIQTSTTLVSSTGTNDDRISSTTSGVGCESSGTAILSLLNENNTLRTRSVVMISNDNVETSDADVVVSAVPCYTLIDPVVWKEQQQQQKLDNENKQILEEGKRLDNDNVITELVDEYSIVDPTTVTGLRQRGVAISKKNTNSTKQVMDNNEQYDDDDDVDDNAKGKAKTTTSIPNLKLSLTDDTGLDTADDDAKTIVIDPFDDNNIMILNLHGCSISYKNQMKFAQKNAIEALQHYIDAATLVAAIQNELH